MNHVAATLTPATTLHTLLVNGVTFNEMREESRWEGFVKVVGMHNGKPVSAVLLMEDKSGFGGALDELFRTGVFVDRTGVFVAGTAAMLEAAGLASTPPQAAGRKPWHPPQQPRSMDPQS